MATKKKKKCKDGFSCGRSCIQRSRTCKSNLSAEGKKVIENYPQFIARIKAEKGGAVTRQPKATPPKATQRAIPKISQEDFNASISSIIQDTGNTRMGLLKIREKFGDKLSKQEFDDLLMEANINNVVTLEGNTREINKLDPSEKAKLIQNSVGAYKDTVRLDNPVGGGSTPKPTVEELPSVSDTAVNNNVSPVLKSKEENERIAQEASRKPKITTQEEFNTAITEAIQSEVDRLGDPLAYIPEVRDLLGGRLTQKQFNDFMIEAQANDLLLLIGGGEDHLPPAYITPERQDKYVVNSFGGIKQLVRLGS